MRKSKVYPVVIVTAIAAILIAATQVPMSVTPQLSKVSYNESSNPVNWVGKDESLRANFSGHFYVVVNRYLGRITLWITPAEGARTTYIRVDVRREFLNGLYLEVEPPWYGRVEVMRGEGENGMRYVIQVRDLGEAGDSTYELTFVDRAPEESLSMEITVEVRDGLFRYRGELPVVILEPFSNSTLDGSKNPTIPKAAPYPLTDG